MEETKQFWIQQGQNKTKVTILKKVKDIDDLIALIRNSKKILKQLGIPQDCGTIKLYLTNQIDEPAIEPEILISTFEKSNNPENPLFLKFLTSRPSSKDGRICF